MRRPTELFRHAFTLLSMFLWGLIVIPSPLRAAKVQTGPAQPPPTRATAPGTAGTTQADRRFPFENTSPPVACKADIAGEMTIGFRVRVNRPCLLRLRVHAGGRRLSTTAHLGQGESTVPVSLKGLGAKPPFEVMWEAEFRFRRYMFERFAGGRGKNEGRFLSPSAITRGFHDHIYVVDQGNDRVQCFDRNYRYLFEFGGFAWRASKTSSEELAGKLDEPSDVTQGGNKEIYVTDRNNNRVVRYDLTGRFLGDFGSVGLKLPTGIAADRFGHLIVCDTDNDRVLRFSESGALEAETGGYGWGRRQFNSPCSACFDRSGNVFIVDEGNRRIQVFDPALRPSFQISLDGVTPIGVFVDSEYFLYVVDRSKARVLILDNKFRTIRQLPSNLDGFTLRHPVDCTMTSDGRLHVLDKGLNAIAVIRVEQDLTGLRGKLKFPASH